MSEGYDKYRSRRNRARVREVLMRDWDPIGVADIPEASDEYDSYVGEVYVLLMSDGAATHEIAEYLFSIATGHMGLSNRNWLAERSSLAAWSLMQLRAEFAAPSTP